MNTYSGIVNTDSGNSPKVFTINRNDRSRSSGIGVHDHSETVFTIARNTQQGHLFLFRGKSGDRLKAMYWDRNGLAIWYKRLEKGRFKWPSHDAPSFEISERDLSLLLDGIDFTRLNKLPDFHAEFAF